MAAKLTSRVGAETTRRWGVGDSGLFCGRLQFALYRGEEEALISSSPGEAVEWLLGGVAASSSSHELGEAGFSTGSSSLSVKKSLLMGLNLVEESECNSCRTGVE